MTREEAKEELIQSLTDNHIPDPEAVEMAIKALEQEPCETQMIDKSNFSQEQYKADLQCAYDCGKTSVKPCEDAISRQAVLDKKELIELEDGQSFYCISPEAVETLLPVTPQPKTGHWIEIAKYSDGRHEIECSKCGSHIFDRGHANSYVVKEKYKYCPRCGAKMIDVPDTNIGKMTEIPTGSEPQERSDKEWAKM